ncbi:unnamed protein product [Rhizophagus irregularis]|nr:unnamed protein product [Rhizophagus irregularis]
MEQTPETELRPIYKLTSKYNLQDALGLKNEKQRWLAYLAPDFPITAGCKGDACYYLKKKNELENNLRVPPQNSPALQDRPPPSPQAQQNPPSPVEPSDEQVQIWPPVEPSDEQVQIRPPEPRTDEQVQVQPSVKPSDEQVQVRPPEPHTNEKVQSNPPKRVWKQRVNNKENQNNVLKKRERKAKSSK